MKTLCITIDCDGHGTNIHDGFSRCFKIFETYGIDKATWFVNERGYKYTLKYPNILENILNMGEIGLHTHLNELWQYNYCMPHNHDMIYGVIKKDKEILERWMHSKGYDNPIISFRSGNLLTNNTLFKVLSEIGFKVDSSVPAFFEWNFREIGRKIVTQIPTKLQNLLCKNIIKGVAYPTVSIHQIPYKIGEVLEIPLNIYAGGRYLNFEWLKQRTKTIFNHLDLLVIYYHPFDLIISGTNIYEKYISWLLETYNIKTSTISDIYENYNRI